MRLFFSFLLAGVLLMVLQGALALWLPPPFCPDLGLLVVICLGLRWSTLATGLLLVGCLGFAADLLSGSLMGQHALLRVLTFTGAFVIGRQFNLKGPLPLMLFTAIVSVLYGVGIYLLSRFFVGTMAGQGAGWLIDALWHACSNALVVPVVLALCSKIFVWVVGEDATDRVLRLESERGPA